MPLSVLASEGCCAIAFIALSQFLGYLGVASCHFALFPGGRHICVIVECLAGHVESFGTEFAHNTVTDYAEQKIYNLVDLLIAHASLGLELTKSIKRIVHVLLILFINFLRVGYALNILLVCFVYPIIHLGVVKNVLDFYAEVADKTEDGVVAVVHIG